jgi:hypothetical protein
MEYSSNIDVRAATAERRHDSRRPLTTPAHSRKTNGPPRNSKADKSRVKGSLTHARLCRKYPIGFEFVNHHAR